MFEQSKREWAETFHVSSYDVGPGRTLRLSHLLLWLQEVAERQLEHFDIGYETLWAEGIVFLSARTWVQVRRTPRFGEDATVVTRPCGTQKAQFFREYEVYVGEELCVQAVLSSVAADPVTHRIHRPRVFDRFGFDPACGGEPMLVPQKLELPVCPLLGERPVRYTDLDYNSHLNNAVYGDFIADYAPEGLAGRVAEFQINYIGESLPGDTLAMYGQMTPEGEFLLYGENARGRGFDACARFFPAGEEKEEKNVCPQ